MCYRLTHCLFSGIVGYCSIGSHSIFNLVTAIVSELREKHMNPDLTPKQQTSEALRQAETILIATGQHPSIDQATAVLASALLLRKLGKKVTAIISDNVPASMSFLPVDQLDHSLSGLRDFILKVDLGKAEVDKLKYTVEDGKLNVHITPFKGGFAPSDVTFGYGGFHYDVGLILGVPTRQRLDRIFEQNPGLYDAVPIINLDFHRSNDSYGAINLIEPTASSLSEILLALAESLQTGLIDENIATVMLTGIIAGTDRFTAVHTTPKSLTVAAQLMAAGAKQQQVVKALYHRDQKGGKSDGRGQNQTQQPSQPQQPVRQPQAVDDPAAGQGFGLPANIKEESVPAEPHPGGSNFDQVAESFNPPASTPADFTAELTDRPQLQ